MIFANVRRSFGEEVFSWVRVSHGDFDFWISLLAGHWSWPHCQSLLLHRGDYVHLQQPAEANTEPNRADSCVLPLIRIQVLECSRGKLAQYFAVCATGGHIYFVVILTMGLRASTSICAYYANDNALSFLLAVCRFTEHRFLSSAYWLVLPCVSELFCRKRNLS